MTHVLVLITLLGWGVAGIFDKKAVERSANENVFALFHLFNIPMLALLFALSLWFATVWTFSFDLWFWQMLAAGAGVGAMLLYYNALSRTDASYVLGITAAYPVVSSLLAAPLLGEALSLSRLAGAAAVSLGVALIGTTAADSKQPLTGRNLRTVLILVFGAALLWGAVGVFEKKAVGHGTPLEAYFAECAWEVLFAILACWYFASKGHKFQLSDRGTWSLAWLSALGVALGNFCVLMLMSTQSASYAIVITACYPLVMYVCAVLFLKENVSKMRLAGIVFVILGGVITELLR